MNRVILIAVALLLSLVFSCGGGENEESRPESSRDGVATGISSRSVSETGNSRQLNKHELLAPLAELFNRTGFEQRLKSAERAEDSELITFMLWPGIDLEQVNRARTGKLAT